MGNYGRLVYDDMPGGIPFANKPSAWIDEMTELLSPMLYKKIPDGIRRAALLPVLEEILDAPSGANEAHAQIVEGCRTALRAYGDGRDDPRYGILADEGKAYDVVRFFIRELQSEEE